MARLILPTALTLPLFIGWLELQGVQAGLYGTEFGFALFATSNIILFAVLVWISAKLLNARTCTGIDDQERARSGLENRVAERLVELTGAKEELQAVLAHQTGGLYRDLAIEGVEDPADRRRAWITALRRLVSRPDPDEAMSEAWHWA